MYHETTFEIELLGGDILPPVLEVTVEYKAAKRDASAHPADAGEPALLTDIVGVYANDEAVDIHGVYVPVLRDDLRWDKHREGRTLFIEHPSGAVRAPEHGEFLVRDVDVLTMYAPKFAVYQLVPLRAFIEKQAEKHLAELTSRGEAYGE